MKDFDLWLIDPISRKTTRWTEGRVSHYSISLNGRIAYDRFTTWDPDLGDRNIYLSSRPGVSAQKLTNDNQSVTPAISPDGTKVVYQMLEWDGGDHVSGKGKGLWLYDTTTNTHREITGVPEIPASVKERRNQLYAKSRPGKMDEKEWTGDSAFYWSPDSRKFLFSRHFSYGGLITFWVDLAGEKPIVGILDTEDLSPIAFGTNEAFFQDWGKDSLVAIIPDSGIRRRMARQREIKVPELSRDGKNFAFKLYDQSGPTIWAMDVSGEKWRVIVRSDLGDFCGHDDLELDWSRDGSTIVTATVSEEGPTTWMINTKTGEKREIGSPIDDPKFTSVSIEHEETPKDSGGRI